MLATLELAYAIDNFCIDIGQGTVSVVLDAPGEKWGNLERMINTIVDAH